MNPGKGNELLLIGALLVALFLFSVGSFRNGHAWGDDFSQYIVQAQSIVDGTVGETLEASRYRYDNSETKLMGPVLYPWGFPVLLSGVYSLFGLDIQAMKLFTSMFFLFSLALIYLLFRGRLSFAQNFLIVLMLGIDPVFFEAKNDVLSDFPFMFFTLLTLLIMQRSLIDRKPIISSRGDNALIGAGMFLSYAVRANGIILLPTLLLVQIMERGRTSRYRRPAWSMSPFLPYAAFLILLFVLDSLLPSSSSYTDQLGDMGMQSVVRNILLYGVMPVDFFTKSMGPPLSILGKILFLVSFPALCLGLYRCGREHYLYFVFSGLFMSLLILWPGIQGPRYIFPVIPFYLFFIFQGMDEAAASISLPFPRRDPLLKPAVVFGLVSVFIFGITVSLQAYHTATHRGEMPDGPYTRDSTALFQYISCQTRTQDVIIFSKPRAMWLFTRRKAIRLTSLDDIMVSRAKYIACRRDDAVDRELRKKIWIARRVFANDTFSLYARMCISPVSIPIVREPPPPKMAGQRPARAAAHDKPRKSGSHKKKERRQVPKLEHDHAGCIPLESTCLPG
jgi:hypothetical protein